MPVYHDQMHKKTLFLIIWVIFSCFYIVNSFICDDAFISFRTIDNFVRGYGLRWNVNERVQVFTNPLYTLLMSGLYFLTWDRAWLPNPHRIWLTSLALSYVLSTSVFVIIGKYAKSLHHFWLAFCILMTSQAYVSFCSSGLETSLSYVFVTLFYVRYLYTSPHRINLQMLSFYSLIVALAMVKGLGK